MAFDIKYTIQAIDSFTPVLEKFEKALAKIAERVDKANAALKKLEGSNTEKAFQKLTQEAGKLDKALQETKATIAQVDRATASANPELDALSRKFNAATAASKALERQNRLTQKSLSMREIGGNLRTVGGTMTAGVTLPVIGGLAYSLKKGAELDRTWTRLSNALDMKKSELGGLRTLAFDLASSTPFSQVEIGEGMTSMAKLGKTPSEIIKEAPAIAQFAAAAEMTMEASAEMLNTIKQQNKFKSEDMGLVADQILKAANLGSINPADFGVAFRQSGLPMGQHGTKFTEHLAAITTIQQLTGGMPRSVGDALQQFYNKQYFALANPEGRDAAAMAKAGLKTTDRDGKLLPLDVLLQKFGTAYLDKKISYGAMTGIFGEQTGELISAFTREGLAKIGSVRGQLEDPKTGGYALRQATSLNQDAMGKFQRFMESIDNMAQAIANSGVLNALTRLTDHLTTFFNTLSTMPKPIISLITYGLVALAILGPILLIVGQLMIAFASLSILLPIIGPILLGIAAFLLPLIGGIALTVAWILVVAGVITTIIVLVKTLYEKCDWFKGMIDGLISWVLDTVKAFVDGVKSLFNWLTTPKQNPNTLDATIRVEAEPGTKVTAADAKGKGLNKLNLGHNMATGGW